jgi:hypothetical protein
MPTHKLVHAIAQYPPNEAYRYWTGGYYELNLTFDTLRDREWSSIMQLVWAYPALNGPLAARFSPTDDVITLNEANWPPPTGALRQHGQVHIGAGVVVGCDVQAMRSVFECVSVMVPTGMFEGLAATADPLMHLPVLDDVYYDLALQIYDAVPFRIGVIGYERSCHLLDELLNDGMVRHNFLMNGNFFAVDEVLGQVEPELSAYAEVRPGLRWKPHA